MTNGELPKNPFESIANPEEEAKQIQAIADLTKAHLDRRYKSQGEKPLRGVHPKSHGCVKAYFDVRHDIPADLRVGLFAEPGRRYAAWLRYSNAAVLVGPDRENGKNDSRGLAIKVLDVDGDVLLEDGRARSQDFLMINTPAFAFANVEDYLRLNQILHEKNDDPTFFFAPLQVEVPGITPQQKARILKSFQLVQQIQQISTANPMEIQYFSAAPFLYGPDRVMKFSAIPWGGEKLPQTPTEPVSDNYLREALIERMGSKEDVCLDFAVQVRGPGGDLGIEDATTVWDEAEVPFRNVATITIPAPQKSIESPRRRAACENLVFTPWHCLAEHQPLGGINRLRKAVYLASKSHRGAKHGGRGRGARGKAAGSKAAGRR